MFKSYIFARGREPHICGTPPRIFREETKPKRNRRKHLSILKFFLGEQKEIEQNPENETKMSRTLKSVNLRVKCGW